MVSTAKTPDEYFASLPDERKQPMTELRNCINKNIPKGFEECMSYGTVGWVVPQTIYPEGYQCNKKLPLPFINIASQKNFISLHHLGIYASPELLKWFTAGYLRHSNTKLDMGKGCIRFKKPEEIPLKFIGELMKKMTVRNWIQLYEKNIRR